MKNGKTARASSKSLTRAASEITTPREELLTLTSPLNPEQLSRFAGAHNANLEKISEAFLGTPLLASNNRIVVSRKEIDMRVVRDPGLAVRLMTVCFALETIAIGGENVNEINVEQAIDQAFEAQKTSLDGITKITREGKKLDHQNIVIPELSDSVLFEPFVMQTTCAEDTTIDPSQTIFLLPSGKTVLSRLAGENNAYLKQIEKRIGDVHIKTNGTNKPRIIITGAVEKIAEARNIIITFAHLIAEFGYKKEDHLKKALACALGDLSSQQLPSPKASSKNRENPTLSFATMSINAFAPASENQQRYVEMMEDDRYPAVMAQGPAGTGKTRLFLQVAMKKIRDHYRGVPGESFGKLILSIPLVNVGGKDLGAMPGNLYQKTGMWFETYYSHLVRILAPMDAQGRPDLAVGTEILEELKKAGIIEIAPLEFLRGKSFEGALVALDEAQNATAEQVKTFLTRAEETSRLFMFGDLEQTDRSIESKPKGEPFKVPSTVKISEDGITSIHNNGRWVELGFYKDIGHFVMGIEAGHIERVYPRNGFAQALLLYSGSPNIGCTSLDFSDIRRSGVGRDLLVLHRGFRVARDDDANLSPHGKGNVDPLALLTQQAIKDSRAGKEVTRRPVVALKRIGAAQILTLQ